MQLYDSTKPFLDALCQISQRFYGMLTDTRVMVLCLS